MKISKETTNVLRNFASINSNLLINAGSTLYTKNTSDNLFATALVAESFPFDFGIYDLNEFLGALTLFNDPDIDFNEKFATITDGNSSIKFYASSSDVLVIPKKKVKFPAPDDTFTMTQAQLVSVVKTASVLKAVDLSFVGDGATISMKIGDLKNSGKNCFEIKNVGTTQNSFVANIKISELKLMPQDYTVDLSRNRIMRMTNTDGKIVVHMALELSSKYE